MPRRGRYFLPDQPLHLIQRGNNRGPIFFAAADYTCYRGCGERVGVRGRHRRINPIEISF